MEVALLKSVLVPSIQKLSDFHGAPCFIISEILHSWALIFCSTFSKDVPCLSSGSIVQAFVLFHLRIFSCYVEYVEAIGPSWKGVASVGFVIVWVWNAKQMFSLFPSQRYATMGIIALNLALHICQEVNIAGFGYPGNHDNAAPIHYYNTGRSRKEEVENASPSNWGVLHREAYWQKPGLKELWALVAVTGVTCGNSCWGVLGKVLGHALLPESSLRTDAGSFLVPVIWPSLGRRVQVGSGRIQCIWGRMRGTVRNNL